MLFVKFFFQTEFAGVLSGSMSRIMALARTRSLRAMAMMATRDALPRALREA